MRRSLVVLAIGLGLVFAGMADAETIRKKIKRNNDLVYVWTTNEATSTRVTTMWDKASVDVDLLVGYWNSDGSTNTRLISESFADGIELAELGVWGGVDYWVVLTVVQGSSAKFQMNVSTQSYETVSPFSSGDSSGVRFVGVLQELALEDEAFAALLEDVERSKEEKARFLGD